MQVDPTDTAELERRTADAVVATDTEQQRQADDMKWLMSGKQGRRIMWRLLSEAGVFRTSFNNNGSVVMFNEGKRHIGLVLMAEIMYTSPEQFQHMLKESTK